MYPFSLKFQNKQFAQNHARTCRFRTFSLALCFASQSMNFTRLSLRIVFAKSSNQLHAHTLLQAKDELALAGGASPDKKASLYYHKILAFKLVRGMMNTH